MSKTTVRQLYKDARETGIGDWRHVTGTWYLGNGTAPVTFIRKFSPEHFVIRDWKRNDDVVSGSLELRERE